MPALRCEKPAAPRRVRALAYGVAITIWPVDDPERRFTLPLGRIARAAIVGERQNGIRDALEAFEAAHGEG